MDWPLKFGAFIAPFHPVGQNPTLALERDLELIQRLDELGFDEAWIGEHHSAGYEIIASPEVFIAVASQRTKHIKLGTGVSSLPYHHPLILADRMVLLDHLTRGRVMFGVGPGALPSDAFMMGIDTSRQREMMEESFEAILHLLTDDEPFSMKTDWFTLNDARLQLRPYTHPTFDVAVAAQVSPAGPRLAGRFGTGLLSIGATSPGRLRRPRFALVGHGGALGRVQHDRRPAEVAPRRTDAHRRDGGAGPQGRGARPAAVDGLLPSRGCSALSPRKAPTPLTR